MLKKRIVAALSIKNNIVVQSIGFKYYLPVGKPEIVVDYLNQWGIDEIIMLDIDASLQNRSIDPELVKRVSKKCFVPLTVGGGISTIEQIHTLIHSGADKISLNTQSYLNPSLIHDGAQYFGSQSIVVSIDAMQTYDGGYEAFIAGGKTSTSCSPIQLALQASASGAGEIVLNSINRDGMKQGYDTTLIENVLSSTSLPLTALGGVKNPSCMKTLLETCPNISAIAAGNYFHHLEHSATLAKAYLHHYFPTLIRMDSYSDYRDTAFDEIGRLLKKDDAQLQEMLFEYHPKEVI